MGDETSIGPDFGSGSRFFFTEKKSKNLDVTSRLNYNIVRLDAIDENGYII